MGLVRTIVSAALVERSFGLRISALGAAGGRAAVWGALESGDRRVLESRGTEFVGVGELGESESGWGDGEVWGRTADTIACRENTDDGEHKACRRHV